MMDGLRIKFCLVFIIFVLFIPIQIMGQPTNLIIAPTNAKFQHSNISNNAILIDGNNQLSETGITEGWLGNGSQNNPYLIVKYTLNQSGNSGIIIKNTDKFIILKNNIINTAETGILLQNVSNIQVNENLVQSAINYGIRLVNGSNDNFTNNIIENCGNNGLDIDYAINTTISNNQIFNNTNRGMSISQARNSTIFNNSISNTHTGSLDVQLGTLVIVNSEYLDVIHNQLLDYSSNNEYGIFISLESKNIKLESNNLIGNAIDITGIYYPANPSMLSPEKITVINNTINCLCTGILLENNIGNNTIKSNLILYGGIGITQSSNNVIEGNFILRSYTGLSIGHSRNNIIKKNYFQNDSTEVSINKIGTFGNEIFNNTFADVKIQVSLWANNTEWDVNFHGNFWSNYQGADSNKDGIGDQSYFIGNTTNNPIISIYDTYPLMNKTLILNKSIINLIALLNTNQTISDSVPISSSSTNSNFQLNSTYNSKKENVSTYTPNSLSVFLMGLFLSILASIVIIYLFLKKTNMQSRQLELTYNNLSSTRSNIHKNSSDLKISNTCVNCGWKREKADIYCFNCGKEL